MWLNTLEYVHFDPTLSTEKYMEVVNRNLFNRVPEEEYIDLDMSATYISFGYSVDQAVDDIILTYNLY